MNVELRKISWREVPDLLPDAKEALCEYAKASDPLFAGLYGDRIMCFVGFVSPTILSDSAYVWLHSTSDMARHKVLVGKYAKRLVEAALVRYPRLTGHLNLGIAPCEPRWLMSLGARFEPDGDAVRFVIGA